MPVFVKQYRLGICAHLGFFVHTLCHYCGMVATAAGNKVSKPIWSSLAIQTHFCKNRERSGEQHIQAVSGPAAPYSARCSILSHDTLHHYLSSNSSLENSKRELGYLFRYCRSCKNISTLLLRERAYILSNRQFKNVLFDIWLHHPANCIPVGNGLLYAVHQTHPFFFLWRWV